MSASVSDVGTQKFAKLDFVSGQRQRAEPATKLQRACFEFGLATHLKQGHSKPQVHVVGVLVCRDKLFA